MKRKIILIIVLVFVLSMFTACVKTKIKRQEQGESMFVIVEDTSAWRVVYHKTTLVMYAVSDSSYNCGTFTVLVDAEGKPLLWNGGNGE